MTRRILCNEVDNAVKTYMVLISLQILNQQIFSAKITAQTIYSGENHFEQTAMLIK